MRRGRSRIFARDGGQAPAFEAEVLDGAELVVDALLGTGIDRPVDGAYRDCIERVNRAGLPVLALDIPSGLDADTGLPRGVAIRATRTLAFIALKTGHYLGEAPDHVGALELAGLDIPAGMRERETPVLRRIGAAVAAAALPASSRTAHKGDHGRVLVIGGFAMAGAARLAGEAALRTGAGLVTIATSAEGAIPIVEARPELIVRADRIAAVNSHRSSRPRMRSRSARDSAPTGAPRRRSRQLSAPRDRSSWTRMP